ncbi:calcium-binding protein [Rhizobium sp. LjRoot258]|uniref:calcium-binding protein n=1 Tax=Rhizobium sp. LjRoot258 TaxID=3342299 RepID=UPI003ED06DDA
MLHGGRLEDVFVGGDGVDYLSGGHGADTLYANDTGPESDAVADYLTGGWGRDAFYVGNVLGNSRVAQYDSTAHDYVFDPSVRGTFDVIRDYSALDKIFISLNEAQYAGLNNTDFSTFSLQPAEYSYGGKDVYVATSNGVSLNAIYDTYYDANLGETITVLIFFETELKTPIFGIQVGGELSLASMAIGGSSGDDVLFGTPDGDTISSGSGDDEIYGDQGDDAISGGSGDDTFYTASADGADAYDGAAGIDTLMVETNSDTVVDLVGGTVTAVGEATDTISEVEAFFTGGGNDHFVDSDGGRFYSGGTGTDSVAFAFDASSYRIAASGDGYLVERVYVDRDAPLDERYLRLESIEEITFDGQAAEFADVVTVEIDGTSSADTLTGSARNDMILGGDGDDVLTGGAGSDILDGGDGDTDRVNYEGLASDYLFTRNADGSVIVTSAIYGTDTLLNVEFVHLLGDTTTYLLTDLAPVVGSNVIEGTAADDILSGGDEASVLIGNDGNDNLSGNGGNDFLLGGNGDDTFNGGAGDDIISGGEGSSDQADYIGDLQDFTFTRNADNSVTVLSERDGSDTLVNVENIRIYVEDLSSHETYSLLDLVPLPTDDIFTANGSPQTFDGGLGSDTVDYSLAAERIWADLSINDDVYGDTLISIENLTGSAFGDYVGGNAVANILRGGDGADGLDGAAGNDTLIGGSGDDWFNGGAGNDVIDGGDGEYDEVDYFGSLEDYSFTRNADHSVTVTSADGGTDTLFNIEDIWLYSEDYSSPYEVFSLADLAPELSGGDGSGAAANGVSNDMLYQRSAPAIPMEGANASTAFSSADIIAFPAGATIAVNSTELGADYQATTSQLSSSDEVSPTADIISLEDFVARLQENATDTDLWFEPEPIGSVI